MTQSARPLPTPASNSTPRDVAAEPTATAPQSGEPATKESQPDLTGRVLSGRYRLGAPIGKGGMGLVYQAEQLVLGRQVAVKLLASRIRHDPVALRRFFAEAKAIAALGHDNIVDIFDFGIAEDGLAFMVMEHLVGQPLDQLLRTRHRLDWPLARHVVSEVLEALTAAHERGIVHRDVKPSNCFAVQTQDKEALPRVKLLDFGIARLLSSTETEPDDLMGSPSYASPEQARTAAVDARSDLYSVGVMMYELVTGHRPFQSQNVVDVLLKQRHDMPPPFQQVAAGLEVPEGVEEFVRRALEKDPWRRFQSAREMARALAALPESMTGAGARKKAAWRPKGAPAAHRVSSSARRDGAELRQLLEKVRRFWLADAEGGRHAPLAPQRRTLDDELVSNPWGNLLDPRPHAAVETDKGASEVFEVCQQELLITGPPGGGKTTVMRQLARELADRVGALEQGEPIPVVFSLATFDGRTQSLETWLVEELRSRYRVPTKLGRRFLSTRRLIPLLDGLDECAAEVRPACVAAINSFRTRCAPRGLAVSCRLDEYRALPARLELGGALHLHALTATQVDGYLDALGNEGRSLRAFLEKNDGLPALARSPLGLSIITTLCQGPGPGGQEDAAPEPTLGGLYERYLSTMLRRKQAKEGLGPAELSAALSRLAANMVTHHQTIFAFHELQATWLQRPGSPLLYLLLSRLLVGLVLGASLVLPIGLTPLNNAGFQSSLTFGLVYGLTLALVTGGVYGLDAVLLLRAYRRGGTPLRTGVRRHARRFVLGGITAALMGAIMYVVGGGAVAPLSMGVQIGLLSTVFFCQWYAPHASYRDIRTAESLRVSWSAFLGSLPVALVLAVVAWAVAYAVEDMRAALCMAALTASMVLLFKSVDRAIVSERETPHAGIHLSLRTALITGLSFALLVTLIFSVAYGPLYAAVVGVNLGTFVALWYGGFAVVLHHALRWALRLDGQPEYRDSSVFTAAVDRLMLRQMGGGYMFLHATFQRHMAERGLRAPGSSGASSPS